MKLPRLLFLLMPLAVFAQEITFEIGPPQIGINEVVSLTVVIEGQSSGRNPTFVGGLNTGDFVLANPTPSRSSQTTIINGNYKSEERFTYYLRPEKQGNLIIPAQKIKYNDKEFTSQETRIEVGEENRTVQRRSRSPFEDLRRRPTQQRSDAELFVKLEVPKTEYYLGEPIPVEIVLYRTADVSITNEGSSLDLPDFKDFWVEDGKGDSREHYETIDRKRYIAYTIIRKLMYPNRTGQITIPAAEFVLNVSIGGGFFADWNRVKRATEPVELTIKPLPTKGKPANFSGLVGSFKIEGSLDNSSVKVGETANLQIKVTGEGNFASLNSLKPELPSSFEIFEGGTPSFEKGDPLSEKTWQMALVPKREGSFEVKIPSLSFFDVKKGIYRVSEMEPLKLEVLPGTGLGGPTSPISGTDRTFVGEQNLSYIKLDALDDTRPPTRYSPKILLFLVLGFLALDLVVFLGLWLRNNLSSRRANSRPRYALTNFRRKLAQLEKQNNNESFHAGLSEAILNYFGDKWERAGQGISLEFIHDQFHRQGVRNELYQKVEECIEACDLARFTPGSPASREQTLEKTRQTIEEIEGALS